MPDANMQVALPAEDEINYCPRCNGVCECEDVAAVGPEIKHYRWRCDDCHGSGLTPAGLLEFSRRFGAIHHHLVTRHGEIRGGGRPFDEGDLRHLIRLATGAARVETEGG